MTTRLYRNAAMRSRVHKRGFRFASLLAGLFLLVAVPPLSAQVEDESKGMVSHHAIDEQVVTGTLQPLLNAPLTGTGFPAAEGFTPSASSFSGFLKDESRVAGVVALAWLELFTESDYLKLRPLESRTLHVDAPSDARPFRGDVARMISLRGAGTPSVSKAWASEQSVDALIDWYSERHDISFSKFQRPLRDADGSMTVAHGTLRMNDAVVTVMLWNPTLSSSGRAIRSHDRSETTIYVEERSFRHRSSLVAEGTNAVVELTWDVPYADLIEKASLRYQVDPFLIAALIQQESGFNPNALSVDSAMGLAQMIPTTAAMLGVTDANDPVQAINGGTLYLKMMLRRYEGNVEYALAAYNAGPGAVDRYRGVPPYRETRDYVRRIMGRWQQKAMGKHRDTTS